MSTQKDAEISRQEPSLFVYATPSATCPSLTESESSTRVNWKRHGRVEAKAPCCLWLVEGRITHKESVWILEGTFKNALFNTQERSGSDRQVDKDKT